jgi:transcriptional regulator with XRE-family HTH domain
MLLSRDKSKKNIFIGLQLKELRNIKNITLDKLATELKIPTNTFLNYEKNTVAPPIDKLIDISSFFGVSCDYLLLWDKTIYPHNLEFLRFTERIDKLDFNERYKIEGSLTSLIGTDRMKTNIDFKLDETNLPLGKNIAGNITTFIEHKQIMRKDVAAHLDASSSQITHYESGRSTPSYEFLVKLSELFKTSIHSIITGEKLAFNIENKGLRESVFKADHILELKDIDFLIRLMKRIIEDAKAA